MIDPRDLPVIGGIFRALSDYAAQGLVQRTIVYGAVYIVAVLLAGLLVQALGWYSVVGVGGTLFIAMIILGIFMYGVDPENEYTKEDILAMWIVMAIAPAVFWALLAAAGAAVAQIASPVVLMSNAAANAASNGVSAPAASAIAQYLGNVLMHGGVLFVTMGTKYVITA